MAKMWAGRFKKDANAKLDSFNTSLPFDCRLYKQDIQGSLVHSKMLEKQGILSKKDVDLIKKDYIPSWIRLNLMKLNLQKRKIFICLLRKS